MARLKKGTELICNPCGRKVIISNSGISRTELWCCDEPMEIKVSIAKTVKKKTAAGKKRTRHKKK